MVSSSPKEGKNIGKKNNVRNLFRLKKEINGNKLDIKDIRNFFNMKNKITRNLYELVIFGVTFILNIKANQLKNILIKSDHT